ncbi:MAG TPA: YggS family pyridoxal phosphate-dependent enzyme [Ktedonobacteraceae bacterium]|nr:YggS family pyridoxal phosphate-dependent enzyme [Ktedonobacteraceae bacterium]
MNETLALNSEQLAENIAQVQRQIARAAEKMGRDPAEVMLVAVSKTKPVELVEMAYNLGVRDFGENRVQEALTKIASFHPQGMRWHLIGHLQSNKAGKVVEPFAYIHSVDSLHLAQVLHRHAEEQGKRLSILLQVNVAGEASKEGMSLEEAPGLARDIAKLSALHIEGLMTVAPLVEDPEEVRPVFQALYQLRERLRNEVTTSDWQHLSMGMTDDYSVAIEEGATIVRVGRAIFGQRLNR